MAKAKGTKLIAQNKKAYHEYFIEETIQAGISLAGTEVKSLRMGKCSLKESYIQIKDGEAFLYNMHISPYEQGNIFNKDPLRPRRLLLHKAQIRKWDHEVRAAGYTIVPLKVYFDRSYVKVDVALAKGKKLYDKRDTIAKNDMRRQAEKTLKSGILLCKDLSFTTIFTFVGNAHGDAMVSTGVLKVGIAIRGPVNRVIKLEPFLKRNDKNNFALAA